MTQELIKARLNLNAVLRNLEELPKLDPETAAMIKTWNTSVRFSIRGDMTTCITFHAGQCAYSTETTATADITLYFLSPRHLNAMFDNTAMPIPLNGFLKLGFLKKEFTALSARLEHFLKPTDALLQDEAYMAVNTALSLYTGAFAVCELVRLDPVAQLVGRQMPKGILQMTVLPEGPHAHIVYDGNGGAKTFRGKAENPTAEIQIRDCATACRLLNGKLDGFGAVALGDVKLKGLIPLIDNTNLILDRIPLYLQ